MEPPVFVDELDPHATLAWAAELRVEQHRLEVEAIETALRWADLHSADPQARPGAIPAHLGGDKLVDFGGDGTPMVAELCVGELAMARGEHERSTHALIADALDLRHRLPKTWLVVREEPTARVWVARKVAAMSRRLTRDQVELVDEAVAAAIATVAPGRLLKLAEAKVIEADTAAHAARLADRATRRGAWISGPTKDLDGLDTGNRTLMSRLATADALEVDATLDVVADVLEAHPELRKRHHPDLPEDPEELTRDVLRAAAMGWLARPADLHELLASVERTGEPPAVPRRRPTRKATVFVHLHADAVVGLLGGEVARVEGIGPVLVRQLAGLLGHTQITLAPVIDLRETVAVDAYEHPTRVKTRTWLRVGTGDVLPWSPATTRDSVDVDHPRPWVPPDEGGPPGQTGDHNAAPLGRRHHRAKTHVPGYRVRQTAPDTWIWRSPHGLWFRVDPDGTHQIDEWEAWRAEHAAQLDAAVERVAVSLSDTPGDTLGE